MWRKDGFTAFYRSTQLTTKRNALIVNNVQQGSFRGGTHGNAVPIVEKLPERMGMAFPLLKCLRAQNSSQVEKKK